MLQIDKKNVDFLVTENMVAEVRTLLTEHKDKMDQFISKMNEREVSNIYFVACGSPLCACQTAQMLFQKYSGIPCASYSGWEFLDNTPHSLDHNSVVIAISDSGKTEEVVNSVKLAREKGALTLGVTKNEKGNPLSDASEYVLGYEGACIWEMHLVSTYYIALNFMKDKTDCKDVEAILKDLNKVPDVLYELVKNSEEESKILGERASKWPLIYTVAAGPMYPIAYKEGIITMLEFTWTHGSVINASEFRHGPLEVAEDGVPYVFMLGTDESRHTAERAIRFVKKLTKDVIVFDAEKYNKDLHPMLAPLTIFVPLEYFYYYLSIYKDHNPDDRRYYGGLAEY